MILELFALGFALSLDNFRASIALGTFRLTWGRALQVALTFGLWDTLAPLGGLLAGRYFGHAVGPVVDYIGPIVLGAYGGYLFVHALRTAEREEMSHAWVLFGTPLCLSLDNLIAGSSLGLLGFSPWLSAAVFGATTVLMSFAGLQLGALLARSIHIRSDLLSGVALVVMASVLALAK